MNAPHRALDPSRDDREARRALLSALADGDRDALEAGCRCWRDDPQARATWHAYHLIGDVMRSDDLALPPGHDAAFVARLRLQLAEEPVVLAPQAAAPRRRHRWLMPVAAAAGFAAVAGVVGVLQTSQQPGPAVATVVPEGGSGMLKAGRIVRDPTVDLYFDAHRGAARSPLFTVPAALPATNTVPMAQVAAQPR